MEDDVSGAKIAFRLPTLAVTHLPLYLQQGHEVVCSQLVLLEYLLSPLFCEPARLCLRLEFFAAKFFLSLPFFFLSLSLAIPQVG